MFSSEAARKHEFCFRQCEPTRSRWRSAARVRCPPEAVRTGKKMARVFGNLDIFQRKAPKPVKKDFGLAPVKGILLYIHVPFCRSKCGYCAFHSKVWDQATYRWYINVLLKEIELWGDRLKNPAIKTIFFGGGTPTLITTTDMRRIMSAIRKNFTIISGAEVTMEANPESARDKEYVRSLVDLGVNRLSLGAQSLDDEMLKTLGRAHTSREIFQAVWAARSAGIANLSIDLIWGLPEQRVKTWKNELARVVKEIQPEHLSCYGLSLEPGTAMTKLCADDKLILPPEQELARMFIYGAELLEGHGYLQYEISNFARMGFTCSHNQGYWDGESYLGLGPAAVSTLGNRRFTNPKHMDEYDAAVRGGWVGQEFEFLDPETQAQEQAMLALRTTRGLNLAVFKKKAGFDILKKDEALIHTLHKNGLIRISQGFLRLTKNGMLVSNSIIERLLF